MKTLRMCLLCILIFLSHTAFAIETLNIPILCYHNLNPTRPGSMNMTPQKFENQVKWILNNGYTVVPLSHVVEYLQGKRSSLPPKSIVITADDGWKSNYQYLYPIVKKYKIPVTLFIYPGTISEGKNTLTWNELKELQQSGFFEIQSHTYTHPNFKHAKRQYSPEKYARFVKFELENSKKVLEKNLGVKITTLAWPFGIYNPELEEAAKNAGYEMAFTIDALPANKSHRAMAEPRYMIVDGLTEPTFKGIVKRASNTSNFVKN